MLAGGSGHTDVVQLLLSSGTQVDLQDEVRHNSGTHVKGRHELRTCTLVNHKVYVFAVYASLAPIQHAHVCISITFEPTCTY